MLVVNLVPSQLSKSINRSSDLSIDSIDRLSYCIIRSVDRSVELFVQSICRLHQYINRLID